MNLNEIIEWDVYNWARALPFWQKKSKLNLANAHALEIGARNGGLSLWMSSICKDVICSDVSDANDKCLALHKKYNVKNINYLKLDALHDKLPQKLDLVVSKSTLSFFDEEKISKVIDNIYESLNEGGEYWFVENLAASPVHSFFRKKFTPWASRWNYLRTQDLPIKFKKFSNLQFKTFGVAGLFGRNNLQRNILGRVDKHLLEHILPENCRYVVVAVARK